MPNKDEAPQKTSVGTWAKRCYMAARAAMDHALRPYGLGSTQWYVLYHLAHDGPTLQRDLQRSLQVERATLSVVVSTLARKGLVEQLPDRVDARQKLLQMTPAGTRVWDKLPDLSQIEHIAFGGMDPADLATTERILRAATERIEDHTREGIQ
ncbi:MarR family transcriptional regulator [Mycolicibacterium sp. BiH015]|uniref:MarR family winged helix-turn-helix transcriptional regulator n=1 Tax=Mycolicibacterium sp. BiH015 TaxID=3018808 RepID=UPI0022E34046|nr:MarR family transcriptional regulator [Mycolicibacterium sp. BiH015]MDA2895023.1 MarR family transcriptional regulator [Mycolicibacterium sp. BiH015]